MRKPTEYGVWIVIAVLSIVTLILYVDNYRTRQCFGDYMSKDNQNTINRTQIADRERDRFLLTLITLMDPKNSPAVRAASLQGYIDEVQRNNQLRKQSPILPVPTECD